MRLGFTNGQQFKAKVRNLARQKQIDPQILMQEIVLDEIVDRISNSPYRKYLILKGGFLIASMLGVKTRSTRDIDTAIKGLPVTQTEVAKVFGVIIRRSSHTVAELRLRWHVMLWQIWQSAAELRLVIASSEWEGSCRFN